LIFLFDTPSFLLNIVTVIVVFFLAVIIWNRRPAPGAAPFTIYLLVALVWIILRSFNVAAVEFSTKVFLGKLTYFGTTALLITWLCFALDYTGSKWWRRGRNQLLLCSIPAISAIILIVNRGDLNGWLNLYPDIEASTFIVVWARSPLVWVETAYLGIILLAGYFVLGRFALRSQTNQRWMIVAVLSATLIPVVSHAASSVGYFPVKGMDLTPFAMMLAGIVYATTIFRFHFLDIIPIARGTLVENIPSAIVVLNKDRCIADINPAARQMICPEQTLVLGKSIEKVCPWLNEKISDVEKEVRDEIFFSPDASGLYLDLTTLPLRDRKSAIKGQVVIIRDVTEPKKACEALEASEIKYRSLVNNLKLGIFRSTPQGRHLEVNKAMETITGYSREELLNMEIKDLYIRPDERQSILEQSFSSPEKASREAWNRKKDGTPIMVAITITPVKGTDGSLLFYDGILEDITERKKLAEQIQDLYEKEKNQRQELEAEAKARGFFINALGHELRTPLTPIVASANLLKEYLNLGPEKTESKLINSVCNGAQVLAKRLEELLDLGKISRGDFTFNLQPVNMKVLIEQASSHFKLLVAQYEQNIIFEISDNIPLLTADPARLGQVLENLVSNACRLSPRGGKVILRLIKGDDGVRVDVQDEGKEISIEERKRLFQPYHRVEQDRLRFPGLGLGLAISKRIIEAHQGKMWITSQPGQGNTFSFLLPIQTQH
jgi:PAS domain S-box-containing protein